MRYVVALLICAQSVSAQDSFSRLSEKTLCKILDQEKIEWQRMETKTKAGKTLTFYSLTFPGGLKASIVNHGNHLTVLSLGFKNKDGEEVSLERANEWNLQYGGTAAAFVDKMGFASLSSCLNMDAGTNEKIIGNWRLCYETPISPRVSYQAGEFRIKPIFWFALISKSWIA